MLVKLVLLKEKRFSYKIKYEKRKDFFIVYAPNPKNTKQKNLLIQFLKPFEKKIIYPKNFYEKSYPAPYPAFEIHCKKLLFDFLALCKEKKPKIAVIAPNGVIKDSYYLDLSEYVGNIVLIGNKENEKLKNSLLAHSGTVIDFVTDYEKNRKDSEYLFMPEKKLFV